MKIYFILLFQFIFKIKTEDYCSSAKTYSECKIKNSKSIKEEKLVSRPLFSGRCCWKKYFEESEEGECIFTETISFIDWKIKDYDCFSNVEKCYNIGKVNNKKYSKCNNITTELPYKCCYVGSGDNHFCLPIDISFKSIFKKTIANLRTSYYDFQGKWEIECSSFYFRNYNVFYLVLFIFGSLF